MSSICSREGLQPIRLHVSKEFSCATWVGCSRVFPPLMLLIKPHAFSSAWSLSLKQRVAVEEEEEGLVLYFLLWVYEHVSVLAVSWLTGAAAGRPMKWKQLWVNRYCGKSRNTFAFRRWVGGATRGEKRREEGGQRSFQVWGQRQRVQEVVFCLAVNLESIIYHRGLKGGGGRSGDCLRCFPACSITGSWQRFQPVFTVKLFTPGSVLINILLVISMINQITN